MHFNLTPDSQRGEREEEAHTLQLQPHLKVGAQLGQQSAAAQFQDIGAAIQLRLLVAMAPLRTFIDLIVSHQATLAIACGDELLHRAQVIHSSWRRWHPVTVAVLDTTEYRGLLEGRADTATMG